MIEMKTAADIILETLEYYGQDPVGKRGLRIKKVSGFNEDGTQKTSSSCEYAIENGETKYCAIGRCLTDDAKAWVVGVSGGISDLCRHWWRNSWAREEFENSNDNPDLEFDDARMQDPEEDRMVYLDDMLQAAYTGQDIEFWEKNSKDCTTTTSTGMVVEQSGSPRTAIMLSLRWWTCI